ncbi:hypothetical protein QTO34_003014, partial [Cnephaeus nilssonii]
MVRQAPSSPAFDGPRWDVSSLPQGPFCAAAQPWADAELSVFRRPNQPPRATRVPPPAPPGQSGIAKVRIVGKVQAGFERIDSNFDGSLCKMLSSSIAYHKEIVHER